MEQWEWAWLAGIYEGEGCMGFNGRSCVQVRICMTDLDVIESIDQLVPSPTGIRTQKYRTNRKVQYRWAISDRDVVKAFIAGILPFLHSRRRERALEGLQRLTMNRGAKTKRTHCPKGHPLAGDNVYIQQTNGCRSCQACRTQRDRERNAQGKAARAVARAERKRLGLAA